MMVKIWILLCSLCLFSCQSGEKRLKIAASSTPHAEMLEVIRKDLKEKGITLEIVVIDDYHLPNRLLAEKQVDANFFQHGPFLENEIADFGYSLTPLAKIHIEPLGIYSRKFRKLAEVPDHAKITIPSDPSNEARALLLLEEAKLIKLRDKKGHFPTMVDIDYNPHSYQVTELDAPLLPRTLNDTDLAVIPGNFALQAHLFPEEALFLEGANSPYVNILVVRKGEEEREDLRLVAQLLRSQKVAYFLKERYHDGVILVPNL